MKLSEFNEYIQTIAALGAIIALFAVGFEIRQSNRMATQQALSDNWFEVIHAAMTYKQTKLGGWGRFIPHYLDHSSGVFFPVARLYGAIQEITH